MNDLVRDAVPKSLPHGRSQTTDFVDPRKPNCDPPNSSDFDGLDSKHESKATLLTIEEVATPLKLPSSVVGGIMSRAGTTLRHRRKPTFPADIFRFFCLSIDRRLSRPLLQGRMGMPVKRGYFEFCRRGFAFFPPLYSRRALSMRSSADTAGRPNVRSCRVFFRFEIAWQDQPPEMELESTSDFSYSEMHAPCSPFFGMTLGHIFSVPFLGSPSVAAFRGPNSDTKNGVYFATSWHAREIIAPEAPHSHEAFPSIRLESPSEGERCMKDTDHPVVHFSVHLRIFARVRRRRCCAWHDDQFGRGQNTGLGWSDPTLCTFPCPK
jgi:hypothetical protein